MDPLPESGLVSIILPTRNRAALFSRAVKSVLAQSYSQFELIVIDEASSDRTPDLAKTLTDSRVSYIRNEISRGPGAARNAGMNVARGEFVAFLDDDDEFLPDKLRDQLNAFQASVSAVGVVISPVDIFRNGKIIRFFPYNGESGNIFLNVLAGNTFPLNAMLVRNHNLPSFDDKLPCLEDIDFCLKVLQHTKAFYAEVPCGICHLDTDTGRASMKRINLYRSFRILESRWFNDPNDVFLKNAHVELLVNFALRQFALGNLDDASREYVNKAFAIKKDTRRTLLKVQNMLGPVVLRMLYEKKQ